MSGAQRHHCPKCGDSIMKSYPNGQTKIWTKLVVIEDGQLFAKCMVCKELSPLPVGIRDFKADELYIKENT